MCSQDEGKRVWITYPSRNRKRGGGVGWGAGDCLRVGAGPERECGPESRSGVWYL